MGLEIVEIRVNVSSVSIRIGVVVVDHPERSDAHVVQNVVVLVHLYGRVLLDYLGLLVLVIMRDISFRKFIYIVHFFESVLVSHLIRR